MEIINSDLLKTFADELELKVEKHNTKYRNKVVNIIGDVEKKYSENLMKTLSILDNDLNLVIELKPISKITYDYLNGMRWVGWGNCQMAPPLGINPAEEYSCAIIIYLSARLIDDAIDGHIDFKELITTLYGSLITKVNDREASGLCTMMGNLVYQNALRILIKKEYKESADILMQLYSEVISGALMEAFAKGNADYNLYSIIIKQKSVAYDMMLNKVFFRTVEPNLRKFLIKLLAEFSETAQWLNDLMDYEDDMKRNQLNILCDYGINKYSLYSKIANSFYDIWLKTNGLNKDLQNAMAARLIDPVNKLMDYKIIS
jgi:hypothetical protein